MIDAKITPLIPSIFPKIIFRPRFETASTIYEVFNLHHIPVPVMYWFLILFILIT